jgi:3-oxoacyl-[acyl-carrier protein] reductase
MELHLRGKRVLITGASRGIGLRTALAFASEGCHLHLAARSPHGLQQAKDSIESRFQVPVSLHQGDIGIFDYALQLGQECCEVDILVNNAGSPPPGTVTSVSEAALRQAWDLKVFGFISLIREIYPSMRAKKSGVIINIAGNNGQRPKADRLASSMANAALTAMSTALGSESMDGGVRVIVVNPGATQTERSLERLMTRAKSELGNAERWKELLNDSPGGRLATMDEIADVVVFLASDRASYISGAAVTVDGGASARP